MDRMRAWGVLILLLAGGAIAGRADVDFYLSTEYSGGTPPSGSGPWLHAHLADVTGGVDLTLTSLLTDSTEFVTEWAFNLDPALDPTHLSFALVSGGPAATITDGTNFFKADGDGKFDILFAFAAAPPAGRFNDSDAVTYRITSADVITAASFDCLSQPSGVHGPYTTAAHVQGTGGGGFSGWIAVPEPATLSLLMMAGIILAIRRGR
jgi:hypothetical protein